jgi:hypothetical protein
MTPPIVPLTGENVLPDSKDDFPKLLYLDQNKWIDLSNAHYSHHKGVPFKEALAAVRKAVNAGRLIVPISAVNKVEMDADPYAERRHRLARFMVDLSCNRSILPFMIVRPWEVRNALHAFFGRPAPGAIRRSIVREGIGNAFGLQFRISGLSAEDEAAVLQYGNSAERSVQYLLLAGDNRELSKKMRAEETATLDWQEQVRTRSAADLAPEQRRFAELAEHIRKGDVGRALMEGLQEFGVSMPAFFEQFDTLAEFIHFFARVHTLEVLLTLTLARDQDLVRPIAQNDARDLIWLSVAMPYGNLVVSEKYWGHMVRSCGLDRKYKTTIITNARDLPARLADIGCL